MALSSLQPGKAADAIDQVVPRRIVTPESATELAEALAWASGDRLATVIRGGGTKLGWGRVPAAVDLVISTARLNQLVAHRHGDLTATVQAGATLRDVNRELGRQGQWLPVESAFEDATIGGIIATNDAGPMRHRSGTPRDLLIGITLALTDGRLAKAGGIVVKNVAGYDLGKLVSGSCGTLAAIVDATFKLMPLPQATTTLVATYADGDAAARDVAALTASQLEPAACDVRVEIGGPVGRAARSGAAAGACQLLVRFASSPAATAAQVAGARGLLGGDVTVVTGEDDAAAWSDQLRAPWLAPGMVVRLSWLPSALGQVLALVRDVQQAAGGRVTLAGRAGVGAGLLCVDAAAPAQVAAVERLRASESVGHVVVLRGSLELKQRVDVWDSPGSSAAVARALKQMFDPAAILNAGRGPI